MQACKMTAYKWFSFDAAHELREFPRVHGHSWEVRVDVGGEMRDGRAVELDLLELEVARVRGMLDHQMLNDVMQAEPTSENIAEFVADEIGRSGRLRVVRVEVFRRSCGFGVVWERAEE